MIRTGLRVSRHWLCGVVRGRAGHLEILPLHEPQSRRLVPLETAVRGLRLAWETLPPEEKREVILPIWCLHGPSPTIGSLRSLLMPALPGDLEAAVAALGLEEPLEVAAHVPGAKRRVVGRTIVDPTPSGITILGNAEDLVVHMNTVGSRFVFRSSTPGDVATRLRQLLTEHHRDVLSTSLLMGGLGAILSFELGFLLNRVLTTAGLSIEQLFAFVFAVGALLVFMIEETFERRMIAFTYAWTFGFKIAAWALLVAFIIVSPAALLADVAAPVLLNSMWLWALLLTLLGITYDSGEIFYVGGFSKRTFISLRAVIGVGIVLFALASRWASVQ